MSTTQAVTMEMDGPLAVITLTHEPHNLLAPVMMTGLLDSLAEAEQSGARAVLLRSGLRHFSGGADIELFEGAMGEAGTLAVSPAEFLERVEAFALPIVVAIHGVCVGGGFELALACDMIIAARSAKIGSVEVTIGLNPLMGAVQRQVQRAGAARAKEMSMLGRRYDAETLEKWNLINRVVDDEHLEEASRALAMELANGPTIAIKLTKELVRIAVNDGVGAADGKMEDLQKALWSSEDLRIGIDSLMKNGPGLARFVGK